MECDLFSCCTATGFDPILEAMFTDLSRYWRTFPGAKDTHLLCDSWGKRTIGMQMLERRSVCVYHEVACGNEKRVGGWSV